MNRREENDPVVEPASDGRYELWYRDAVSALRFVGARVGVPYIETGKRLCAVNGLPRTDHEIFVAAWGEARAAEISRKPERDKL